MLTRRDFALRLAGSLAGTEMALAQGAVAPGDVPAGVIWLNANENPEGPPQAAIEAMRSALASSGRYHFQDYREFTATVAASEGLSPYQVQIGAGSTEVLSIAVQVLTAPDRPLITVEPTFEVPMDLARSLGRPVVRIPLTPPYAADVKRLAAEAARAGGGLIYLCNPNNPTGSVTPKADIAWLAANLPAGAVLLLDEAYFHFGDTADLESGLGFVQQGRDVMVARTFSKIWGMAGLRCGFVCAPPGLLARLSPYRNNVISYPARQAVMAALAEAGKILPDRRARYLKTRRELCEWLTEREVPFIESHANFVMIEVGRDARELIGEMTRRGVAVGRPFPPLLNMMRVSIGTDPDMARFREVFWGVYRG